MPMAGGTAKNRFCHSPTAWYGASMQATSNDGMGTGKCMEFQNQNRLSSASRRDSWNSV